MPCMRDSAWPGVESLGFKIWFHSSGDHPPSDWSKCRGSLGNQHFNANDLIMNALKRVYLCTWTHQRPENIDSQFFRLLDTKLYILIQARLFNFRDWEFSLDPNLLRQPLKIISRTIPAGSKVLEPAGCEPDTSQLRSSTVSHLHGQILNNDISLSCPKKRPVQFQIEIYFYRLLQQNSSLVFRWKEEE